MFSRTIKILIGCIMLLHFAGVTQYALALAKDKSSFVTMANMNEEETKKEKDAKEELNDIVSHHTANEYHLTGTSPVLVSLVATLAKEEVKHQHIAEQLTPPPDLKG